MNGSTDKGARVYNPLTLRLYDWWVLSVSNQFAWKCPTEEHLVPHFLRNLSKKHMDIGVGTGFYLTHAPKDCTISLMDLNKTSLDTASARAGDARIDRRINHDVFAPYDASCHNQFDSVSMFYLLHCLPGTMSDKGIVIRNAAHALTDNGVLYGATILGDGVEHNAFGRKLMGIYNRKGIFSNSNDSAEGLREILSAHFVNVSISVEGTVALFSAARKK